MKILLIDNYDSFTFNLYHYISSLGINVDVVEMTKSQLMILKKISIIELSYLQDQVIQINQEIV